MCNKLLTTYPEVVALALEVWGLEVGQEEDLEVGPEDVRGVVLEASASEGHQVVLQVASFPLEASGTLEELQGVGLCT